MAILVTIKEIQEEALLLNNISIEKDGTTEYFWLTPHDKPEAGLRVEIPYGADSSYDCNHTEILILQNPFQGEADVLEVFVMPGSRRIGYSFSTASAGSTDHRLSNCKHFKKACYAASRKTLEKILSDTTHHDLGSQPPRCSLGELLDKEIAILTIHKPWLDSINIQNNQLIADLYRHAYIIASNLNISAPLRLDSTRTLFASASSSGQLKIAFTSEWLANDELIGRFIGRRTSCPDDAILRFFYLYQITERLIELETRRYSSKLIAALTSSESSNSIKIMTAFHDLKEALSEKSRIKSLFGERSGHILQNSTTISAMVDFLKECDIYDEKDTTYGDLLYRTRNVVFHGWWSLPDQVGRYFDSVISGLEIDIPEMLLNYCETAPPTFLISELAAPEAATPAPATPAKLEPSVPNPTE